MSIIDKFVGWISRSAVVVSRALGSKATSPRFGGWYENSQGGNALSVSTVYRCVNLLADSVANLPMQYMLFEGGIFKANRDSRLHYLLNVQPCPHLSAVDFWQQVVQSVLLRGNAYILPIYDPLTLEISHLYPIDPSNVLHDTTNDTYRISNEGAGISGTYGEDEILHIKNFSIDGKIGISTLTYARLTIDTTLSGDRETKNRFDNGGNVRGFISNDTSVRGFGEYQDKELEKTAEDLDYRYRAGGRIVAVPGQAKFTPFSLSSTDMQFLETRKFSVREICRFFGVHPSFVFDDTSNNYVSAEMANVAFLSTTLNPILRKIEVELLRKLVASELSSKRKFEFDRRGLYASDLESRINYQTKTIAAGIYTVNEWRKEENKPAVAGGDTVLVSANLKGINEANQNAKAKEDNEE